MLRLAFERGEEEEPSAPNPTESQKVKPIRRGRLPKKKGETGQVPIIAGLQDGEVSRLRVDAQGAWTLEPREDAFAGKPVGGKAKNVTERFIVTRDDGATCHLTITLKITEKRMRTKGGPVKPTKRAVYVGEKPSSWTHKRHPVRRREKLDNLARARAFIRTVDEVEHFAGPAPVPLRAQGQLGINQPLVPLAFEDIRNIEFDIQGNRAFGDGREFQGLRFFEAPLSPSLTTEERRHRLQATANEILDDAPTLRKQELARRVRARLSGTETLRNRRDGEENPISVETVERQLRMPPKRPRRPL